MIRKVIELLQSDDWMSISEEVEIAKGRDQTCKTFKQFKRQMKRIRHSKIKK